MQAFSRKISPYGLTLHLLVLGLAIVVLLLVRQNADLRRRLVGSPPPILAVGDTVPPLRLVTLDGVRELVHYDATGPGTLLLIFNTSCPACRENLRAWDTLAVQMGALGFAVRGVSLHPLEVTRAYRDTHGIRFAVSVPEDSASFRSYKAWIIPLTLVVGPGGIVRGVKTGALGPEAARDIVRAAGSGVNAGE